MPDVQINGVDAVRYIKDAYGLNLGQVPTFAMDDPTQQALRRVKDWITMAEHDALKERAMSQEQKR